MSILNDLKYAVNIPTIRGKFDNLKKKFHIDNKNSEDVVKDFKRQFPEFKTIEGNINGTVKEFLQKIYFTREDDGGLYLKAKEQMTISALLYIPRGINIELHNITIDNNSKLEVANIFNIYGTEGFTIRLRASDIDVVIEPTSSAGVKGLTSVAVYSIEDGKVVIDDATKYIDCSGILEDYRG